jgi:hypothetical protein
MLDLRSTHHVGIPTRLSSVTDLTNVSTLQSLIVRIEGAVCVVTGAANGIGRALATEFSRRNAVGVVVADLDIEYSEMVADRIRGVAMRCEVEDGGSLSDLVAATRDHCGRNDIFCSNAGYSEPVTRDVGHARLVVRRAGCGERDARLRGSDGVRCRLSAVRADFHGRDRFLSWCEGLPDNNTTIAGVGTVDVGARWRPRWGSRRCRDNRVGGGWPHDSSRRVAL